MMKSLSKQLAAVALVGFVASCSRCGSGVSGRSAEEFVPPETTGLVSIPNLGKLADGTQALLATARGGAGGDKLVAFTANLARQLGFDPLTRDGLKTAGIDASQSMALAAPEFTKSCALAVVPAADKGVLEATLLRLAKDRAGLGVKGSTTVDGLSITTLAEAEGGTSKLSYAMKDGFLLLSSGDSCEAEVAAAAKRTKEQSVFGSPVFAKAKERVGAREAMLMLPKSSSPKLKMLPDVAVVGIGLTGSELGARAYLGLAPEQVTLLKQVLIGGGNDALARLPKEFPLYLRGAIDWAAVVKAAEARDDLKYLIDRLREAATTQELDLDAELLGNIEPGFALTFGLAKTANLSTAFDLNPRSQNPFDNYTLLGTGRVKDEVKARATLAKMAGILEKFGMVVRSAGEGDKAIYTAAYRLGDGVSWSLRGKDLIVAGGWADALPATIEGLGDKTKAVQAADFAPRARDALFGKDGVAMALDLARLAKTVTELPMEAFGSGPGALMARSVVSGFIQPLARLKGVLAVAPVDNGVVVDLSIALQ